MSGVLVVSGPFVENKEIHIPKCADEKDHLWHPFEDQVDIIAKIPTVRSLEEDSPKHLQYSYNHTQLHFQRIKECELVRS